jgi:uncharacterized protein
MSPDRPARRGQVAAFWDTTGVVPLCCWQPQTKAAARTGRRYTRRVAWWGTAVEATSALHRLHREREIDADGVSQALARLDFLRRRWSEIVPTDDVRSRAERLLGVHSLRAAEALQLAAALVWCRDRPRGRAFVAGDGRLADAAAAEGFQVVRLDA